MEMSRYFKKGTIFASIYHQPHRQGQIAVRLMADHLISKVKFPPRVCLSPAVVMLSNLHLFRETRLSQSTAPDGSEHRFAQSTQHENENSNSRLTDYTARHQSILARSWTT